MTNGLITRPGISNDTQSIDGTKRTVTTLLASYGNLTKNADGIQLVDRLVYGANLTAGDPFEINSSSEAIALTSQDTFAGIAQETLAATNTGRVVVPGFISGRGDSVHTGLTPGARYYLSANLILSLTRSAWYVGRAISATQMLVFNPLPTGTADVPVGLPIGYTIAEYQAIADIPADQSLSIDQATATFTSAVRPAPASLAGYVDQDAMADDAFLDILVDGRSADFTGPTGAHFIATKVDATHISFDTVIEVGAMIRLEVPD